jgi:hypothetical protein
VIALCYLNSNQINRQVNISTHFRTLSRILRAGCDAPLANDVFSTTDSLRRRLREGGYKVLYLLAHSNAAKGMVIGGRETINGRAFVSHLPSRRERLPRLVFFNTCDGVASGLVEASLRAGVQTVVAAAGPIRIDGMCGYAEGLFQSWVAERVPLAEAVQHTNEAFTAQGVRFEVFGDQAMASLTSFLQMEAGTPMP